MIKKTLLLRLAMVLCFMPYPLTGYAHTLVELFDQTIMQEPTYLGQRATLNAAVEKSWQALAGLFPQVTASVSTNFYMRDYITRHTSIPRADDQYNNNQRQLNYTHPIWHHATLIGITQAQAVVQQNEQQLFSTEQELGAKLVSAWCEVLQARDHQLLTKQQAQAAQEQWTLVKRGVAIGTHAEPSLAEAQSKYEQAQSDQEAASIEIEIKMAALEQLTGKLNPFPLPTASHHFNPHTFQPETIDYWNHCTEQNNPSLRSAYYALEAAQEEIRKQRAGHEPTLDMVMTYSSNNQNVGNFPGQNGYQINQKSLGLQMNIPIFSGGGQNAKVAEAIAMADKARYDLENARRTALLTIKQSWLGWKSAYSRYTSAQQTIRSAELAIKQAEKGIKIGTKIVLDRLQAQQQLASAQEELNKSIYTMLTMHIKLKATAGQLTRKDIHAVSLVFAPAPH